MVGLNVQRSSVLIAVGGAHVALALTFSHAGMHERVLRTPRIIETRFIQLEKKIEQPPPEAVRVEPVRMNIDVAAPVLEIALTNPVDAPASSMAPLAIVTPSPIPVGEGPVVVEDVQYVEAPKPRYPTMSRRLREQGTVILKVLVDEHGDAKKIEIADSSGHERLDRAAVEAVAGATFRPFLQNGMACAMLVLIPIEFGLHRARG